MVWCGGTWCDWGGVVGQVVVEQGVVVGGMVDNGGIGVVVWVGCDRGGIGGIQCFGGDLVG